MHTTPRALFRLLVLPAALILSGSLLATGQSQARINLATVPGTETAHHVITQPGSYYLAGDLHVTKPTGVNIRVAGVTLDLNGHEVRRVSGDGGHGILIAVGADGCTVRDGAITGFAYGVRAFSEGGKYLHLRASHCAFVGLEGGGRWLIANCEAGNNPAIGIATGDGSTVVTHAVDAKARRSAQNGAARPAPGSSASIHFSTEELN